MKIRADGVVGLVYTTEAGMEAYNLASDEGEYKEGWEQISVHERRLVVRKRISHNMVTWSLPIEKGYRPMSHREDGALF